MFLVVTRDRDQMDINLIWWQNLVDHGISDLVIDQSVSGNATVIVT